MSVSMNISPTATSTSATVASSAMSTMSMGGGSSCKISMLWNWYTIDACFLSSTWHIHSKGIFALTCIGVVLLVMSLEFLRRLGKEYDKYLARTQQAVKGNKKPQRHSVDSDGLLNESNRDPVDGKANGDVKTYAVRISHRISFRPSIWQQLVRALLHMFQFGVAYFIMLLAMYYNGFIIISILIGAFIGSFVFNWEALGGQTGEHATEDPTVCCG